MSLHPGASLSEADTSDSGGGPRREIARSPDSPRTGLSWFFFGERKEEIVSWRVGRGGDNFAGDTIGLGCVQ